MLRKCIIFCLLSLLCFSAIACKRSNNNLIEFTYGDDYLWNGNIAYVPEYVIVPLSVGDSFGYCVDELGKNAVCEIAGENRDEWIYIKYEKKWIAGDGRLYKAVSLAECGIEDFGVTTIEIQDMGKGSGRVLRQIKDQTTIDNVISILHSSDYKQTPEHIDINESKLVVFLSTGFPGLKYESILRQDNKGNKYLTNLEDASQVHEITGLLDY